MNEEVFLFISWYHGGQQKAKLGCFTMPATIFQKIYALSANMYHHDITWVFILIYSLFKH